MLDTLVMVDKKLALVRAIENVGGLAGLAEPLGITVQAVSQWSEVPPLRVIDVERLSGVSRHDLRPDLYPDDLYPDEVRT